MSITPESSIPLDTPQEAIVSRKLLWTGRVISALSALLLLFSGAMKVAGTATVLEGFSTMGYPDGVAIPIGIVEILCAVIYLVPQTAVLGAILVTGYLGGATDVHVRMGQSVYMPIIVGIFVWLGLYLRDPRLRSLLPLRKLNHRP